jgi:hypothetical protein
VYCIAHPSVIPLEGSVEFEWDERNDRALLSTWRDPLLVHEVAAGEPRSFHQPGEGGWEPP